MTAEDDILQQIDHDRVVCFTKDDRADRYKALDKLRAFGLVYEQPKNNWRLTDKGYKAVSIGFDKWLLDNENPKPFISGDNVSIITGDGNNINQSWSENARKSPTIQTNNHTKETKPAKASWLEKATWVTAIILFIMALYEFIIKHLLYDD